MKVTTTHVTYISALAHLDLNAGELQRMVCDLNAVLGHIEALNELDTAEVPPMAAVPIGSAKVRVAAPSGSSYLTYGLLTDVGLHADVESPSVPHEKALANAPGHDENFFRVPKVIER